LLAAVLFVFGQTTGFGFVNYDDLDYVYENMRVMKGLTLPGITWSFTHAECSLYHPLTMVSLMLDYQLHGLAAGGYHLTNVLIHAASAILLFLVLRQMTGALWRSAFVAAVFAIHPLRVESVAWVAERKDVLAGFFFMLTLGAYTRFTQRPTSLGRYLAALAMFGFALLCKPSVVTVPFLLLLLDYWPLQRFGPGDPGSGPAREARRLFGVPVRLIAEKLPFLVLAVAISIVTMFAAASQLRYAGDTSMPDRIANAFISYAVYLRQTFWPAGLAVHYPFPTHPYSIWETLLAVVLLASITAAAWVWRHANSACWVGWIWYLGVLIPMIGVLQVGYFAHADRNTYLPGIGMAIAATWLVADAWTRAKLSPTALGGLAAGAVVAMVATSHTQTSYWRNSQSLWTHSIACTVNNCVAEINLGETLLEAGNRKEAIVHYRKALEANPRVPDARVDLGVALDGEGQRKEAIEQFRKAIEIKPDYAEAYCDLGKTLLETGNTEEAITEDRKALEIDTKLVGAYLNLGAALAAGGKRDDAIVQYRRALEIRSNYDEVRLALGKLLSEKGQREEAILQFSLVAKNNPTNAEAEYSWGNALAVSGKTGEAMTHFRRAVETSPDNALAHFGLGCALAALDKWEEAVTEFRAVVKLNPGFAEARHSLGKALFHQGDYAGAMVCFRAGSHPAPGAATPWEDLGNNLLQRGDLDEAIYCLQQSITNGDRSGGTYSSLGLAHFEEGNLKAAVADWRRSLQVKPDEPSVQNNLAWLLATTPDASLRDGTQAVALAEKANQGNGGGNPAVLHTLAAAYAEAGRFEDATATARRAQELAVAQKNSGLTAMLENEIKLYQAAKPVRDVAQ
jgi:tetratricopeptide (TPR) repeat protein